MSRGDIASAVEVSESHLSRVFSTWTGGTFGDYVRGERMRRAETLLRDRAVPVKQVAVQCGYPDDSYFGKVFRAAHGISPGAWRLQAKG